MLNFIIAGAGQIFSLSELKQLSCGEKVLITFYYGQNGLVKELAFKINRNTLLTELQVSKIEDKLKNIALFKVYDDFKGVNFLFLMRVIDFKKIYTRETFD